MQFTVEVEFTDGHTERVTVLSAYEDVDEVVAEVWTALDVVSVDVIL